MLQQVTVSKHAGFDSLDIWAIGSQLNFGRRMEKRNICYELLWCSVSGHQKDWSFSHLPSLKCCQLFGLLTILTLGWHLLQGSISILPVFPSQRTSRIWDILYFKRKLMRTAIFVVCLRYLQSVLLAETDKLYLCLHLCHTKCITVGKWYLM